MNWKQEAQRKIVGDKKELKTFPGYWIRPKKYSIAGQDAINAEQRRLQKGMNKKAIVSVAKRLKINADGREEEDIKNDIMDSISDDELSALMDSQYVPSAAYIKIRLKEGIESHNFCDAAESKDIDSLAEDILDYPEITEEMLQIVEDYNRPLAVKGSKKSKTPQNGSITEQNLNTATNSRTDGNQQK
ncbi:MAG: hypothetical protein K9L24_01140 [Spirochaetia bacterium]|nr:hypothetical protein [Spirochaetia bacterium]